MELTPSVVRLPQVHDTTKQGLITYAIAVFREKGACAYIGDGHTRWAAAHVLDVARLYRLAIERAEGGAIYHAVAEEGVSNRAIAETLADACGYLSNPSPLKRLKPFSAGSPCLRGLTSSAQAKRRRKSWDGSRPGPD